MAAQRDVERYLDLIGSQYQGIQPPPGKTESRFMAHTRYVLELFDDPHRVLKDIPGLFNVQTATGEQLDIIGTLVGADRRFPPVSIPGYPSLLDDDMFRMVVLAKIMNNQWDGTNGSFRELWDNTIGAWMEAQYIDNQDMTITALINGTIEPILTELILAGYIVPKPAGVGMNVYITQPFVADGQCFTGQTIFDSAEIGLHYPYEPQEDQTEIKAGSALPFNNAVIEFPSYQVEQQDTDTFMHGAALSCNNALYSVTIQ